MLTPKQLKTVTTIVGEEQARLINQNPREAELGKHLTVDVTLCEKYYKNGIDGLPTTVCSVIRISPNATLEHSEPSIGRTHAKRIISRAIFRIMLRCINIGIPVTTRTKEWIEKAVWANDFREEAEQIKRTIAKTKINE